MEKYKGKFDDMLYLPNGYKIISYHSQSCCEQVYADFSVLDDTAFYKDNFDKVVLEGCDGGFRVNGYFVPCYDIQNGYYSNNLKILLLDGEDNILQQINEYDFYFTYDSIEI